MRRTLILGLLALAAAGGPAYADDNTATRPIVEEPLALTIHMHNKRYPRYDESWPVEIEACRRTNICLKNATVGSNTEDDKEAFNLLLASGTMPDIVGMMGIRDVVNKYGPEGAFQPLNDLIDQYAPNIKAILDENPNIRSAITSSDGNIYFIPDMPDGKYTMGYFIRYDWLDKLGLDVPQTVDELHEVLLAFRNGDPNGNGLKDEIPFFDRAWQEFPRLVTLWDGRTSGSDTYYDFYVDDGKIAHGFAGEGYHVGIRNLAQWYSEGLIDPEIFTRGSSSREYLLSENLGGMTHDWFASTAGYNDSIGAKVEGFDFRAFPPPASVSGVRMEETRRSPVRPDGWAITYANEHPVETMKYFDFYFSPEGKNLVNFGVEGVQWDMVDGKAKLRPDVLESTQPVNMQMIAIGAGLQTRGYPRDYEQERQWTNQAALDGIALYDQGDYLIDLFPGVALSPEEQAVYDKKWPPILDCMLEKQQVWLLGSADVDADWEGYLKRLDTLGYGDVLAVMQQAYDRQYGE
ncbi:extracellular solute-binding protein [Martelella endophytica]|uniref:extracellular solute-binding protein n=1 Tax=Martelella endophytica TaxID=1486262 RepID=UPI0005F137F3|nr:extracellular solute-binding protein [Martelella endophytica]